MMGDLKNNPWFWLTQLGNVCVIDTQNQCLYLDELTLKNILGIIVCYLCIKFLSINTYMLVKY